MSKVLRVSSRNATFQQWQALLVNRTKRQRAGEFLVQGVRPITLAVRAGWPLRALLFDDDRPLSGWAQEILEQPAAQRFALSAELIRELGGKDDETPELLAVVEMPGDDLSRLDVGTSFLGMVFDRPTSPGNIGNMVRALDAFAGSGLIVSGHAADPYDPKAVRASTGSLFAVPVVRSASSSDVLAWVESVRDGGVPLSIVGTDEDGEVDVAEHDLRGPTLVLIGNETTGLSAGWRQACDRMVRIPISGSASSLNAANAATVVLYEATRQRRAAAAWSAGAPPEATDLSGAPRFGTAEGQLPS